MIARSRIPHRIFAACSVLFFCAFLCACSSSSGTSDPPDPEPARGGFGIERGQTTKAELLVLLGPPDEARQVGELEAWWYTPQTQSARDPHAHSGGGASSGAAGAVGKSMAWGGVSVLLGQLIPGGSSLGGAVASGMARSGIMSVGSQAISRGGEALRAKDEETARQTMVVLFAGDVVRDYAFADAAAQDGEAPEVKDAGEAAEAPDKAGP